MEKAVLILSDTQLVTGLAILIGGYSQLNEGISAYHWQIMIYVAWFSSFSFLSAMAFLEDYFQANQSLRIIRVFFMFILASFLIVALIPTGSDLWLNLYRNIGFYPSLDAKCYYEQMVSKGSKNYTAAGGIKLWSMIVSIFVVAISYLHSGVRLFDPTANFTRRYIRAWPGSYLKRGLLYLERRSMRPGIRASLWTLLYLLVFGCFAALRAAYDIFESMLLEILWLAFAIAWGTVRLWDSRGTYIYDVHGDMTYPHSDVLEEDHWSFGQTLPLVLLLLPILSMAQAYLDNDAKAAEATRKAELDERASVEMFTEKYDGGAGPILPVSHGGNETNPKDDLRNSTACSIRRCNHHPSVCPPPESSIATSSESHAQSAVDHLDGAPPPNERSIPQNLDPGESFHSKLPNLPRHPYPSFAGIPWYNDLVLLLIGELLWLGIFGLVLLRRMNNVLGLSVLLRNRLFLIWVFGFIPVTVFVQLSFWYIAACLVKASKRKDKSKEQREVEATAAHLAKVAKLEKWPVGKKQVDAIRTSAWGRFKWSLFCYWVARMLLVSGCLHFTFFVSVEVAGPTAIEWV